MCITQVFITQVCITQVCIAPVCITQVCKDDNVHAAKQGLCHRRTVAGKHTQAHTSLRKHTQ